MTIIVSKNGKNAKKVPESIIPKEDYLQKYIYDNPDSIPLYDIKEDIRLLILAREFPTDSGPVDALGIDKDGQIYLVETKLYKNPDKRLVVAQVLDYGASLWHSYTFDRFIRLLDDEVNVTFSVSLNQKLKDFFEIEDDEEISTIIENVKNNLENGNFKFVVLMDKLHSQLKDLILFINKNSQFSIFAVELEYYKYEDYEIIIPRLFGAEAKTPHTDGLRKKWDEQSFFADVRRRVGEKTLTDAQHTAIEKLYNFSKTKADIIRFGRGEDGSFNVVVLRINDKAIYSVYTSGTLRLYFSWLHNPDFQQRLKQLLVEKGLFALPADFDPQTREYFNVSKEKWMDHSEQFQNIITKLLAQ